MLKTINNNLTFHAIYKTTVYIDNFPPLYNHCLLKHIIMDKIYANAKDLSYCDTYHFIDFDFDAIKSYISAKNYIKRFSVIKSM